MTKELIEKVRKQIKCHACNNFFSYYKHDGLVACKAHEIIDYFDGFYINEYAEDCDLFEFDGDKDWFNELEDEDD